MGCALLNQWVHDKAGARVKKMGRGRKYDISEAIPNRWRVHGTEWGAGVCAPGCGIRGVWLGCRSRKPL